MTTMRAAEFAAAGEPLRMVTRPVPVPGPGAVRVRVDACGVCGSDLLVQAGGIPGTRFPLIPGHEAAGIVDAVGPGVSGWTEGDQAAIYYMHAPPDRLSARGRPNLSLPMSRMGVERDGAFAEYVVVPATTLIRPPAWVDPVALAVLTDAVATPYHAMVTIGRVQEGETVVVIGIGGIGSNAVQLGRHLGARVVAVTRSAAKRDLAARLGADAVVDGGAPDVLERIAEAVGDDGTDVVVQCVGDPAADELAIAAAGRAGRVVLVGAAHQPFQVRATDLIWRELEVRGSRAFTAGEIAACIDLYLDGSVTVDHLMGDVRPLSHANDALEDLRSGRVMRAVVDPRRAG